MPLLQWRGIVLGIIKGSTGKVTENDSGKEHTTKHCLVSTDRGSVRDHDLSLILASQRCTPETWNRSEERPNSKWFYCCKLADEDTIRETRVGFWWEANVHC